MANSPLPEVWLRGPIDGIPPLLQPVAHTLLQAREEVEQLMNGFPEIFLWVKPAGMACPAFHIQHMAGVINRQFTYARGELLTQEQLATLSVEGREPENSPSIDDLFKRFSQQVDDALKQLSATDEQTLTEVRGVGRAQIPSTVLGLYMHAAEHVMRHVGQLLVTVKILNA
jgi:hypothetical protein